MCAQFDACEAFLAGEFADAREHVARLRVSAEETNDNNIALLHLAGRMWLGYEAGSLDQARAECTHLVGSGESLPGLKATLMLFQACPGGDPAMARTLLWELLGNGVALIPRDLSWTMILAFLAETAALLEDSAAAEMLYDELRQYRDQMIVLATGIVVIGAADRFLGLLAPFVTGAGIDKAVEHFEAAADLEYKMRTPTLLARTRYWHARTLNRNGRRAEAALILRARNGRDTGRDDHAPTLDGQGATNGQTRMTCGALRRAGRPNGPERLSMFVHSLGVWQVVCCSQTSPRRRLMVA